MEMGREAAVRKRARRWIALAGAMALACVAFTAQAADDPSIRGDERTGIHKAMRDFIADQQGGGDTWLHYDPVNGQLLRLRLKELHDGIVKKGDFFVSCADFVDPQGTKVDLDFLVLPTPDGYRVNQAIVHKVGKT
ncbi:MAG: hypothetical protein MJE66_17640, partial [Proteobacteria bacterium]|nr:hypothetical protein [Pseudomonadota bacterium]